MVPILLLAATTAAALAAVAYRRVTRTRARLLAYLRETAPEVVVTRLTPLGFVAEILGVPMEVDLASLLRRRPRVPEAAWFAQILAGMRSRLPVPAPPPLPLVQDRIMPLLRSQADVNVFAHYPPPLRLVVRPLVDGVVITYVIGSTDRYTAITRGALEAWGLSVEALHALAIENLRRHTHHVLAEIGGPRTRYEHLDRYDATRVLAPDLVVPADVHDPVVAFPEETVLLVTPAAQASALAAEAAARYASAARPLSPRPYRLTAAGLVPVGAVCDDPSRAMPDGAPP
ncbi:MAG: hypothetical protein QN157_12635 [Armatimonadota bacterium]|nr:hypothetical protein [Armatimonadota bacterium]